MSLPNNFGHLNRLSIPALAEEQQFQGKLNNCVFHTIATIMNIHFGWKINGADLAREFDQAWWKTPFWYRLWPNWAAAPFQTKRVFRKKAKELHYPVQFQLKYFSEPFLINTLRYSHKRYPIITFVWAKKPLKLVSHKGKRLFPMQSLPGPGAHTMLLAAYDPNHKTADGVVHPWGFVNSWATDDITDLFWMSEETWQTTKKLRTLMVILN